MKFQYLSSLKSNFWILGSLALTACGSPGSTAPSVSSVDSSYAALVGEIANCAKEVKSCVDAAGDATALDLCREQFASCRENAGEHAISDIAKAVRGCTEKQNTCVKEAHGGGAAACHEDLNMCLGAAHAPNVHDDADGDVDVARGGRKNGDCLQELHTCVEADGPANACAEAVRSCVVDTMPSAGEVVPEDADSNADEDADESADESADERADGDANEDDANHGQSDGHGRDAGADNAHDNAAHPDAGAKGEAAKSAARECVDAFAACVDAGSTPRSCVMALKQCHRAGK